MIEEPCVRGCVRRGEHFAACADYGRSAGEATCRGCAPVPRRMGALICDRDYRRLRRLLDDAPDLIGLLRSRADPMRSTWNWDRVIVSGSRVDLAPAPVAADIIDAGDQLMELLWTWGQWASHGALDGRPTLVPGASAPAAQQEAMAAAVAILGRLDELVNDHENVLLLCSWTLAMWLPGEEGLADARWTLARALQRWPLAERPFFAAQPCPSEMGGCGLRAIRVFPARTPAGVTRYVCQSDACGWERDDSDTDGDWPGLFSRRMGAPGLIERDAEG